MIDEATAVARDLRRGGEMSEWALYDERDEIEAEIARLKRRLDEIEEELGWAEAREERRNAPIVL